MLGVGIGQIFPSLRQRFSAIRLHHIAYLKYAIEWVVCSGEMRVKWGNVLSMFRDILLEAMIAAVEGVRLRESQKIRM